MPDEVIAALVLAAGRGERLGTKLPKAFVPVGGMPMISRSIECLLRVEQISPWPEGEVREEQHGEGQ